MHTAARPFALRLVLGAALATACAPRPGPPSPISETADTLGLYMPLEKYWALLPRNIESSEDIRFQSSLSIAALIGSFPLAGDFDGMGSDTVGFFDPRENLFHLKYDNNPGSTVDNTFALGSGVNQRPVAGRWNGGSKDTVGVFDLATATFQLKLENVPGPADITFVFGTPNVSLAMAGDWTGSGNDSVGVYDPGTGTFQLRNASSEGPADLTFVFGPVDAANMVPLAGDWDGDGVDTVGLYDRASYVAYLRNSNSAGPADEVIQLERTTWSWWPIAGRWRASTAPPESPGYDWPTAAPEGQGMNVAKLDAAFAKARSFPWSRSLVVIRHGKLLREEYFNGNRPEIAHDIASAGKSIMSVLYGVAAGEGQVPGLDATLSAVLPSSYIAAASDARVADITLGELLTMMSGIAGSASWGQQIWPHMALQSTDHVTSLLSLPLVDAPGAAFHYSTGNTMIMSKILTDRVGPLDEYARTHVFDPLGIKLGWWNHGPTGEMFGGGMMGFKARDFARIGYLYLSGGKVDGQQRVPELWVDFSTAGLVQPNDRFGLWYGCWWWHTFDRTGAGSDIYAAMGYGGQYLFVIPSKDAVFVTQNKNDVAGGAPLEAQFDALDDLIFNDLLPAFE